MKTTDQYLVESEKEFEDKDKYGGWMDSHELQLALGKTVSNLKSK